MLEYSSVIEFLLLHYDFVTSIRLSAAVDFNFQARGLKEWKLAIKSSREKNEFWSFDQSPMFFFSYFPEWFQHSKQTSQKLRSIPLK